MPALFIPALIATSGASRGYPVFGGIGAGRRPSPRLLFHMGTYCPSAIFDKSSQPGSEAYRILGFLAGSIHPLLDSAGTRLTLKYKVNK
jgi:hypothetical protein